MLDQLNDLQHKVRKLLKLPCCLLIFFSGSFHLTPALHVQEHMLTAANKSLKERVRYISKLGGRKLF